jgi:hypothetical protein
MEIGKWRMSSNSFSIFCLHEPQRVAERFLDKGFRRGGKIGRAVAEQQENTVQ